MKQLLLIIGLLLLFAAEILRVYFIMPFPGSQHNNTISIAYWLNNNIFWIRILALVLLIVPLINIFKTGKKWMKILLSLVLVLYGVIFFFFNFRFEADKMFYQPKIKLFSTAVYDTTNKNKLIIGVAINGEAKAYPIEIIGYHHEVKDTVGEKPVLVTYCTVCRTGRVYSPFVNGKYEQFRLVGMDHFNAMFEDATTKSWWMQATGKAISGKLKGTQLDEIPSRQMQLSDWLLLYPNSLILQPDSNFKKDYADLKGYDEGTLKSKLEKRDSSSWKMKSWVVGVVINGKAKAYDWNELTNKKMIEDVVGDTPLIITLAPNRKTFYVMSRKQDGNILHFMYDAKNVSLKDDETKLTWNLDGYCVDGAMKGKQLRPIQAYQEFWHSWNNFHPLTTRY